MARGWGGLGKGLGGVGEGVGAGLGKGWRGHFKTSKTPLEKPVTLYGEMITKIIRSTFFHVIAPGLLQDFPVEPPKRIPQK